MKLLEISVSSLARSKRSKSQGIDNLPVSSLPAKVALIVIEILCLILLPIVRVRDQDA